MKFDKYRLSDVTTILGDGLHGTPKYNEQGEYYFINGNNLSNGKIIIKEATKKVTKDEYEKYKKPINERTLLVSINGTLGNIAKYNNEKVVLGKSACFFNISDDFNLDYIYYILNSKDFQLYIDHNSTGTTIKNVSLKTMRNYQLDIPEKKYQDKIAKILGNLDSKIELNNQMIATLEELAAVLFKRWFVDFEFPDENGNPYKSSGGKMVDSELGEIPEGWEVSHLKNIATIIMGQSPKGASYNTEGKGLPLINGASDFKNGIITPQKFTTEPKKVTQPKDLIFGVRATIGGTVEVEREYAIGRGAGIARAKEDEFREYLFLTMNNLFNFFSETATGSVYINISRKDFEDYGLVIPSSNTIELFHKLMEPIFNQISDSRKENNSLTAIRNALLPKLLSGDLDV